jgi:hypothetical protein
MLLPLALLLALLPAPHWRLPVRSTPVWRRPPVRLARRPLASAAAAGDGDSLQFSAAAETAGGSGTATPEPAVAAPAPKADAAAAGASHPGVGGTSLDPLNMARGAYSRMCVSIAALISFIWLTVLRRDTLVHLFRRLGLRDLLPALAAAAVRVYDIRLSPKTVGTVVLCAAPLLPSAIHRTLLTLHLVTEVAKQTLTPDYHRSRYRDSFLEAGQRPLEFASWALAVLYSVGAMEGRVLYLREFCIWWHSDRSRLRRGRWRFYIRYVQGQGAGGS